MSTDGSHPAWRRRCRSALALLTGDHYSEANVDMDHFAIALASADRDQLVSLDLVSHGTRDQVALLLRLALCDVLGDAGESIPLLLDEPLASADPRRGRGSSSSWHSCQQPTRWSSRPAIQASPPPWWDWAIRPRRPSSISAPGTRRPARTSPCPTTRLAGCNRNLSERRGHLHEAFEGTHRSGDEWHLDGDDIGEALQPGELAASRWASSKKSR